jgi:hypothetical protein
MTDAIAAIDSVVLTCVSILRAPYNVGLRTTAPAYAE